MIYIFDHTAQDDRLYCCILRIYLLTTVDFSIADQLEKGFSFFPTYTHTHTHAHKIKQELDGFCILDNKYVSSTDNMDD